MIVKNRYTYNNILNNKKSKILFVYINFSTFVEKDFISLNNKANVIKYKFIPHKQLFKFTYQYIKQLSFLIKNINKIDIIYCWFSDYHSFLPALFSKLFNKKMVIITGGTDAVCISELNYGTLCNKNLRSYLTKKSYQMSNLILPVNKSLIKGTNYYANKNGIKTGIKNYVDNITAEITEVATGYDSDKWKLNPNIKKEKRVITVAQISDMRTYKLKGIDLFIDIAKQLPDTNFVIIGMSVNIQEKIKKDAPSNLIIYEFIENNDLINHLAKAKVYCQFSLSEGLPNALCEAMLCECVPVGSNVNGIPDGIGDTGFILHEKNSTKATELVVKALNSETQKGIEARNHIINNFSHKKREELLFNLLEL